MAMGASLDVTTRVVVVDDDECSSTYLRNLLQSTRNFFFVGSFANGVEALNGIPLLAPDLVLMDVWLPDLNGIECTKQLKQSMPYLKIVMVTGAHDGHCVEASLRAGAAAYLIKSTLVDQFLATLTFAVSSQNVSMPNHKLSELKFPDTKLSGAALLLSPRERQVLANLAKGLLYKEIAESLGISFAAVHKHQHNIFKKLDVNNRSEAIRKWLENGGDWV
jgi:two-component system, NarL family, response regulator LiaR